MKKENKFYKEESVEYNKLENTLKILESSGGHWIYRGQHLNWNLETSIERYCKLFRYPLTDAPGIELEMIRNFQRVYNAEDREYVKEDMLYCISLMRHYGAPSRLLDFTYSKHVAMYFGVECAFDNPAIIEHKPDYDANRGLAIWCINTDIIRSKIESKYTNLFQNALEPRKYDDKRNDDTFKNLYMENTGIFVIDENPIKLHQRLDIQQGVFLCPGSVAQPFMENLSQLCDRNDQSWIYKYNCELNPVILRDELYSTS